MPWSFRLTSYNILADAYASKRLFPAIEPAVLSWRRRAPAIVERVAQLEPDVVCLQEVQASHWPELQSVFEQRGWHGTFAQKRQSRLDGCAILSCRDGALRLVEMDTLYFEDGEHGAEASGHLAMISAFDTPAGLVRIANTHLRWQAGTTQPEEHIGYRQAVQLLEICSGPGSNALATIICGDFNVSPENPVVQLFGDRGFVDAYGLSPQATCNPNGRAKRIDYIFATRGLTLRAEPLPELADDTPMPNSKEPSDHLPLTAFMSC